MEMMELDANAWIFRVIYWSDGFDEGPKTKVFYTTEDLSHSSTLGRFASQVIDDLNISAIQVKEFYTQRIAFANMEEIF